MSTPGPRAPLDEPRAQGPLFVEKQTYRRRRIRDAIRALPALGVLLWMVPLLWSYGAEPMRASTALIYLFGVWLLLALVAGVLVGILNKGDREAKARAGRAQQDEGAA